MNQHIVSSGPLRSRAAKAIGFIDMMIDYSSENAPLQKELSAGELSNLPANVGCIWLCFLRNFCTYYEKHNLNLISG